MKVTKRSTILIIIFSIVLAFTFLILAGISNFQKDYKNLSKEVLLNEAIALYKNMVNTRSWNASHDGVFVFKTDKIKPNPYLPNNHIYAKDGRLLVRVNPAWMTRQISEISNKTSNYFYKITSLNPINPNNKADVFEKKALDFFDRNKDIKYYSNFENNKFNFMGSLKTTENCLQCHAHQGYKLGDIRGGLRISIPTESYEKNIEFIDFNSSTFSYIIVFLAALAFLIVFYFLKLIYKKQDEIVYLNENLEHKVVKRTEELQRMLENEKYLKDVLKLVADVNEILIQSYSYHSIIRNSIEKLIQHRNYKFIWSCTIKDNQCEILYKSQDFNNIIRKNRYELDDNNKLIKYAIKAAQENKVYVYEIEEDDVVYIKREEDLKVPYGISIPFNYDGSKASVTIYTNRKTGFEEDEHEMLKKIVADIDTSISSQKQQNAIIEMENEKVSNYEETILAFVNIIEQRDTYTAGHTIRVAQYCRLIAKELGVEERKIKKLEQAAILHDIGKVAIPDSILLKPGKLTSLEYELIKYHSEAGYEMLSKIEMYKDLADTIRYHHSRYDGFGYPKTKSPDEIPFLSHIMILADAFDAMTTNRIYKPRKGIQEALVEIKKSSGEQFHPDIVEAALIALKDLKIDNTTQLPHSDLEEKRFSYFFQDSLTQLYNEHYIQPVLISENNSIKYSCCIQLRNFTSYNKNYGWEEGNNLLIEVADILMNNLEDKFIFRFHGDDFLILSEIKIDLYTIKTKLSKLLKPFDVSTTISIDEISEDFDFKKFR